MPQPRPTSVMLVDDHPPIVEHLRVQIEVEDDMYVAASCQDAEGALATAVRSPPDVAVVDIGLPGMNGIELTRRLVRVCPHTRVVVLSMHNDEEYVVEALLAGVSAYVLKDEQPESIALVVRAAREGKRYFSPGVRRLSPDQGCAPAMASGRGETAE